MARPLNATTIWPLVKQTFDEFFEDKAPRLGAALAYYTIFSLAPLLLIAIGITGWVTGHNDPQHADSSPVVQQVANLVGGEGGEAIKHMIRAAGQKNQQGAVATVVGIATLLFGAAGVFGQLQDALNTIWEVAPKPGRGIWGFLRDRFLSFAMVGGVCFLLLVSLVVSAGLAAVNHYLGSSMPGMRILWTVLNLVVSLGVITLLFGLMFKTLPDVKMAWRDVWIGAVVTALLFIIGKWAIGVYLGRAGVGSAYGAAGSLVVLLVWLYYSSQVFLLGAEFTHVYAKECGSKYVPDSNAVAVTDEARAQEGIPRPATLGNAGGPRPVAAGTRTQSRPMDKPGRVLPVTLGLTLGFAIGRIGKKPKKLVLAPGVRIATRSKPTPKLARAQDVDLLQRFRKGWRRGVESST